MKSAGVDEVSSPFNKQRTPDFKFFRLEFLK
jgi:hypothetical protein